MYHIVLDSLLLAVLSTAAPSLTAEDMSSPLLLHSVGRNCAINFGKDRSYGAVHGPEFVFYDGVRCDAHYSGNASTGFAVGESQWLRDVADAAETVADVVTLRAQVFQPGLGHDRMGKMRSRKGVVRCGERGLHEVMFIGATRNGTVEARGGLFRVQKGSLYAFVHDVISPVRQHAEHAAELREDNQRRLCFFKGELRNDGLGTDVEGGTTGANGGTAGIIVSGVLGGAVLGAVLYCMVFALSRKAGEGEKSVMQKT